jgi:HSP20 family protein
MATRNTANEQQNQQSNQTGQRQTASGQSTGTTGSTQSNTQGTTQQDRERPMRTSREEGRGTSSGNTGRGMQTRRQSNTMSRPMYGDIGSATDPFSLLHRLSDDMDRLFQGFGFGPAITPRNRSTGMTGTSNPGTDVLASTIQMPQIDMYRRGDQIVVSADLPGMSKDDISVNVEDNMLTIHGERQQQNKSDENEDYYWNERSYGAFERTIPLPEGVDAEKANASFHDGVLEITMPAPKESTQRGHKIDIH